MKNLHAYARKFASQYRKIKQRHSFDPSPPLEPLDQLVVSFLQWNSTRRAALVAYKKLMSAMVDHNDLRISRPQEITELIGPNYAQAVERATRMHDSLQEIYVREHAMSLASLSNSPKKNVRVYLETLPGITPYVAAQTMALCFGAHAIPVDDKLAELLIQHEVVDPDASLEQIAAFIERQLRAGQAIEAHLLLQSWADSRRRRTSVSDATDEQETTTASARHANSNVTKKSSRTVGKSGSSDARKNTKPTTKQSSRR